MFARAQGFIILSRDIDYHSLSVRFGHPPKVILVRIGNCTTLAVASLMRRQYERIVEMVENELWGILVFEPEDTTVEQNGHHA